MTTMEDHVRQQYTAEIDRLNEEINRLESECRANNEQIFEQGNKIKSLEDANERLYEALRIARGKLASVKTDQEKPQ